MLRSLSWADHPDMISSSYNILEQCSHTVAEHISTSSKISLLLGGKNASSTASCASGADEAEVVSHSVVIYVPKNSVDIPSANKIS